MDKMTGYGSTIPAISHCLSLSFLVILLSPIYSSGQNNWLDNHIVVADSSLDNLYQVDLASHNRRSLPVSASQPIAVAVDFINKDIFWTDVSRKTINRYSLITSNNSVLYTDPTDSAVYDGIAVDSKRQKVYFTDEVHGRINEMSEDGTSHRILYENSTAKPRAVVLHSENRELYWTDWSRTHAGVYKSSIVNPRRITLVTGDLRWPNALTIDFSSAEGVMYWGDAYLHKLESSDLNGNGRRVILQDTSSRYFGLAIDATFLYATDWESRYIRRINRQTFATSIMITQLFQRLCGIALVENSTPLTSTTETTNTAAGSISTSPMTTTSGTSISSRSTARSTKKSTTAESSSSLSTTTSEINKSIISLTSENPNTNRSRSTVRSTKKSTRTQSLSPPSSSFSIESRNKSTTSSSSYPSRSSGSTTAENISVTVKPRNAPITLLTLTTTRQFGQFASSTETLSTSTASPKQVGGAHPAEQKQAMNMNTIIILVVVLICLIIIVALIVIINTCREKLKEMFAFLPCGESVEGNAEGGRNVTENRRQRPDRTAIPLPLQYNYDQTGQNATQQPDRTAIPLPLQYDQTGQNATCGRENGNDENVYYFPKTEGTTTV